jgi:hypothetical protein
MCSFSLLASNLLSNKKKWNNETSNTGGWASSSLNEFLNSRLYEAFPAQIRSLLKKVSVKSSIGDESIEVSSSACYIAIPAIIDVSSSERSAPYHDEGTPISFMTSTESRKRAYKNGAYDSYWLRSPSIVTTSAADYYVWSVSQAGATNKVTAPTTECGVLIEISF